MGEADAGEGYFGEAIDESMKLSVNEHDALRIEFDSCENPRTNVRRGTLRGGAPSEDEFRMSPPKYHETIAAASCR
jgi:hypothetical protein